MKENKKDFVRVMFVIRKDGSSKWGVDGAADVPLDESNIKMAERILKEQIEKIIAKGIELEDKDEVEIRISVDTLLYEEEE